MTVGNPTAGTAELARAPAGRRVTRERRAAPAKSRVAIVVPTYNEAGNLPQLVDRIFSCGLDDVKLIVVDDGSPDGTGDLATLLGRRSGRAIELVQRDRKRGLGTAYVAGFKRALGHGADYVIQMDADMSHDPGELPEMLAALREADVVVGSRYVSGARTDSAWGPARRLLSMVGNRGIRLAAGLEVRDATSGFKAFRTDVLRAVDFDRFKCGGFGFQAEMAIACKSLGYRVLERPISFETRASGRSKMSLGVVIEAVWRLLPLAWSRSLG